MESYVFLVILLLHAAVQCQASRPLRVLEHSKIQGTPVFTGASVNQHPCHQPQQLHNIPGLVLRTAKQLLATGSSLRQLQQHSDSSYAAYSHARTVQPRSSGILSRYAITEEDAEATVNAAHTGIKRLIAPSDRRSYATVEPQSSLNPNRKEVAIQPRAKAGADRPGAPYAKTGTSSQGILAIGGAAVAQTYEGANAVATTDSVAMTKGAGKTAVSANLINTQPSSVKRTAKGQSVGMTAQPVGSLALSGNANGMIMLAQADSAVSMVQVEKSNKKFDEKFMVDRFEGLANPK